MYLIALVAALAGLLFGYDAGVISGAMLFIKQEFFLNQTSLGLMVSMVPFGALIAALCCGRLNDLFGRKLVLTLTALLYMAGSLLSAFAPSIQALIAARFLLGLAIGLGSYSAPIYIAEISRLNNRGALVTLNQLAITVGIMLSYIIDYVFAHEGSWRWMVGCGFIPAIILFLCLFALPESPRWLLMRGFADKAKLILTRIHGEHAQAELQEITAVLTKKGISLKELFSKKYIRVLGLGIIVSIFTQAVGINAIIYYAPTIFETAGLTAHTSSTLATVGIGLVNVLFTLIAVRYLDHFGRRKMLLTGVSGIIISLFITSIAFHVGVISMALAWVIILSFVLFVACQAIGTGPACWLIPSEIFPIKARGIGMGISVAFNWGANVVVAFFFPIVLACVGAGWTFSLFLLIAVITFILFYTLVPETKGVSLERIEANLAEGVRCRELGR